MTSLISISPSRHSRRALTLVELMVTMALFSLVTVGFIYAQLFGLRQDQLVQSKLGASDSARRGFDLLADDIRASKVWEVGNMTASNSFVTIANGTAQVGNALRVGTTVTSTNYTYYYFDSSAGELRRKRSNQSITTTVARYLTNSMQFRAEDYRGAVQTNLSHKGVINVKFEFYQYQYPLTRVGSGYLYDYYKMQFKLTPHVPDGQ